MRALLLILITATGCASWQQATPTNVVLYKYKADVQITLGDKTFDGMAVTKIADEIPLRFYSKARLDLIKITTCHRELTIDRDSPLWQSSRHFAWTYKPTELEKTKYCPIFIQALDRNGLTAWGYIAFRSTEIMPAKMNCNGEAINFAGISVCQTATGLEQLITFARPAKYVAEPLCQIRKKSENAYYIRGIEGFCMAVFTDMLHQEKHRVVLLNYDSPLIRSE